MICHHGWKDGQIRWIEKAFPDEVAKILMTDGYDEGYYEDESDESDEEDGENN